MAGAVISSGASRNGSEIHRKGSDEEELTEASEVGLSNAAKQIESISGGGAKTVKGVENKILEVLDTAVAGTRYYIDELNKKQAEQDAESRTVTSAILATLVTMEQALAKPGACIDTISQATDRQLKAAQAAGRALHTEHLASSAQIADKADKASQFERSCLNFMADALRILRDDVRGRIEIQFDVIKSNMAQADQAYRQRLGLRELAEKERQAVHDRQLQVDQQNARNRLDNRVLDIQERREQREADLSELKERNSFDIESMRIRLEENKHKPGLVQEIVGDFVKTVWPF